MNRASSPDRSYVSTAARGCERADEKVISSPILSCYAPRVKSSRCRATYQDIVELPEHVVGEIVDGELYASPRPASPHARAASVIGQDLGPFDRDRDNPGKPGGWWILFEPELHFGPDVLVPD